MDGWKRKGGRAGGRVAGLLLLGGVLALPACSSPSFPELDEEAPHAAGVTEKETRFFTIAVDGKKAGQYRMAITSKPDGTLTLSGKARLRVCVLVVSYTYSYDGTETYQDGRLTRFQSHANDNGKEMEVSARRKDGRLHLRAGGRDKVVSGEPWITSYWRLPPGESRDRAVLLLDGDTGKLTEGKLCRVGEEVMETGGKKQTCSHYRVTGGPSSPVNLWYDAHGRLVRQNSMEDGHQMVLELTRVIRRQLVENQVRKTPARAAGSR